MSQHENGSETTGNGRHRLAALVERITSGVWCALAWLSLSLAAWVAMNQISSTVAEVTPSGQYPVSSVLGPGQLGSLITPPQTTLMAWNQAMVTFPRLTWWLICYVAADLLLVTGVVMLGLMILRGRRDVTGARALLAAAAVLYVADAVLLTVLIAVTPPSATGPGPSSAWAWILHGVTEVKWLVVIVLVAWSADRLHASYRDYRDYRDRHGAQAAADRPGTYAAIKRVLMALKVQRFSVVVVVLLGLIAIGPHLNDVFEQMPDVQRAWLGSGSAGIEQLLIAAAAQLLLALLLFLLGRMRLERARQKFAGVDHRAEARHLGWFVPSAAILVVAGALAPWRQASVSWSRVVAFAAVLVVIAATSWVIERLEKRSVAGQSPPRDRLKRPEPAPVPSAVHVAQVTGDALAVAVVAVVAVGVVRAFTVPVLVSGGLTASLALLAGIAGSLAVPLLAPWAWQMLNRAATVIDHRIGWLSGPVRAVLGLSGAAGKPPAGREEPVGRRPLGMIEDARSLAGNTRVIWFAAAPFILADLWLLLFPLEATHVIGSLGTAVIAIGSLASLLGALAYLAQTRLPLPVFRALRLNATPVITIVLIIALVGGVVDRNSALHKVPPVPTSMTRPTFADQLAGWLGDVQASCAVSVPGAVAFGHPIQVEPLVLVATAGGGIRAAWWTVQALSPVARSACGAHDVLAVSSVSGGSVGMAVLASIGAGVNKPADLAKSEITTMAGPDALSAGIDGLLLRDTVAGYTGINLWAARMHGTMSFPDRASLMAKVWQSEDPSLGNAFLSQGDWLRWALLFNSTSVSTGCRAIISTVRLPLTTPAAPGHICGPGTAGLPGSYDFLRRLPCMRGITMATAALLSARYTYITPSATINRCSPAHRHGLADQLVDGGYGEASGLSTLVDLAPTVMSAVRGYNDHAIASAAKGQPITLVVPVTAYLRNSTQAAPTVTPVKRVPEPQAVRTAQSNGPKTELTSTDALLQDMGVAIGPAQWVGCTSPESATSAECARIVAVARLDVPDQLITIAPREAPGVAAPLGWQLSQASEDALSQALSKDVAAGPCGAYQPSDVTSHPYCLPGNGGLADLLALLKASG